ncbi:succinylglutamate desuccinylase/aspartoacylase family protein [Aestuariivivens sp. NBU2969]|uniref:succinylglutamate desuccinylase/aspartoacylase domain-containing protein n=1 Tax=Aestuariivivens sp. NBU2969 TaxID=2873267 RepID=UPI001CBC4609|nr:succinylglutamate desuccinylase/aspartoacylase family protein [Aestuariivivens sp. NBU2969]
MAHFNRIIKQIKGLKNSPTLVFFGGIHGNEKAGINALKEALKPFTQDNILGNIYAIAGNLKALDENQRYLDEDLNRLWTNNNITAIKNKKKLNSEERELLTLLQILTHILETNTPPFYFIDLHTTSSKSLPFITINDALINRRFSKQFPVPIVLGIEEYLDGALLSYINQLGYVSIGFESGQHDDIQAFRNHVAFINLALAYTGIIKEFHTDKFKAYYHQLKNAGIYNTHFFEIIDLYRISKNDQFKMCNGFDSFQTIRKGEKLAIHEQSIITSQYNAKIFMPLYQKKGSEGFFVIKSINTMFLQLSVWLRLLKADNLLSILPGIIWHNKEQGVLKVNLKVAKFFAKPFFHLLGYRSKQTDATHLLLYNRERVAKTEMYKEEHWYR